MQIYTNFLLELHIFMLKQRDVFLKIKKKHSCTILVCPTGILNAMYVLTFALKCH